MTTNHRIAAITGAAGALGSAVATALVARGYKVALFDTPATKDRLDALASELGGKEKAFAFAGDFSTASAYGPALAATKAALGGDPTHAALVAGGWDGGAPIHELEDDAVYERMLRANVDTAYGALRALLPAMVAGKRGSVVVVGSRAAERPWTSAGAAAYAAAKAAVVAMSQAVAEEVLSHGVRVNAILPSTLDTPANRASMPSADATRWVSLPSAAGVVAFLLSDEARDVSGAAVPIYGRA